MKNSKPKVAVILLNFNGAENTTACLRSLSQVKISNFSLDIIIVDNHSNNDSCLVIEEVISELYKTREKVRDINYILIYNNDNLGFSGGNNIGIRKALENNADYVFILNNDTIVDKMAIFYLLKISERNKNAGIIGPKIYFAPGFEYYKERYKENESGKVIWYAGGQIDWENLIFSHRGVDEVDHDQFNKTEPTGFVTGCAMFIKKDVFKKVKLFDQRYFLYLEDVDLCRRAKRAGFKLWYEPKAYLWHKNASSSGKPGSSLHVYYQTRNRLLFGFKYASLRTKFALLRESLKMLTTDNVRRQAVLDFFLGKLGKK